jgi:hypothetical protein
MPTGTDESESADLIYLRFRISGLESYICELLAKNERLRSALSDEALLKWINRSDEAATRWH